MTKGTATQKISPCEQSSLIGRTQIFLLKRLLIPLLEHFGLLVLMTSFGIKNKISNQNKQLTLSFNFVFLPHINVHMFTWMLHEIVQ